MNQIDHLGRSYAAEDTSNYNLVKPNDIVYTKSPTGKFPYGIIKQSKLDKNVAVSPLYGVYTPINKYLGLFLDYYFSLEENAYKYLRPIIQKGAKNTINISNSAFLSNTLIMPTDLEEQKALVKILEYKSKEIRLLERELAALKLQEKGLRQSLLTGKVRVQCSALP